MLQILKYFRADLRVVQALYKVPANQAKSKIEQSQATRQFKFRHMLEAQWGTSKSRSHVMKPQEGQLRRSSRTSPRVESHPVPLLP